MKPTSEHVDALGELVNIGAGRAAGVLNEMLNSCVSLHVPDVKILPAASLSDEVAKLEYGELFVVRHPESRLDNRPPENGFRGSVISFEKTAGSGF